MKEAGSHRAACSFRRGAENQPNAVLECSTGLWSRVTWGGPHHQPCFCLSLSLFGSRALSLPLLFFFKRKKESESQQAAGGQLLDPNSDPRASISLSPSRPAMNRSITAAWGSQSRARNKISLNQPLPPEMTSVPPKGSAAAAAAANAAAGGTTSSAAPVPGSPGPNKRKSRSSRGDDGSSRRKRRQREEEPPASGSGSASQSRSIAKEHTPPEVRFKDLGGLADAIAKCLELVIFPLIQTDLYSYLGIKSPRGVLLHGPPGCGKTRLAQAIAGEVNVPFLSVAAPALVSGTSGESEKALRDLFAEAVRVRPAIIFLDEIDAITPKRETAQREMERRIVAQLLTCMDGQYMHSIVSALSTFSSFSSRSCYSCPC